SQKERQANGNGSGEVAALRTQTSDTFAKTDGSYQTVAYPGSINFKDDSGAWQPIDDTLVPTKLPGYAYQNKANRYTMYLPTKLSDAPIRVASGSAWVTFALANADATLTVSGQTGTYKG